MPYSKRTCALCNKIYVPPRSSNRGFAQLPEALKKLCPECRRATEFGSERPDVADEFEAFRGSGVVAGRIVPAVLPAREPFVAPDSPRPPMKQVVFDLETWGLDRGWGVTMVGVALVHGEGPEPKWYEFDLRQSARWPEIRSDDSEVVAGILKVLSGCHIAYAHNGLNFDFKWLRSVALRYGMPSLEMKLVDPCQIARNKYLIGRNSLGELADFLGLDEQKMPVGKDTWRRALLDNHQDSWEILRERCRSDVRLLNEVAGRVTSDVGMVDNRGSAWR